MATPSRGGTAPPLSTQPHAKPNNAQRQKKHQNKQAGPKALAQQPTAAPVALNMHTISLLIQSAAWLAARDAAKLLGGGGKVVEEGSRGKRLASASAASQRTLQALSLARKSTLRLDPSIKRSICKRCSTFLIPGLTLAVRYKVSGPHGHVVKHVCTACSSERSFPAPPLQRRRGETRKRVRQRKRREEAARRGGKGDEVVADEEGAAIEVDAPDASAQTTLDGPASVPPPP